MSDFIRLFFISLTLSVKSPFSKSPISSRTHSHRGGAVKQMRLPFCTSEAQEHRYPAWRRAGLLGTKRTGRRRAEASRSSRRLCCPPPQILISFLHWHCFSVCVCVFRHSLNSSSVVFFPCFVAADCLPQTLKVLHSCVFFKSWVSWRTTNYRRGGTWRKQT